MFESKSREKGWYVVGNTQGREHGRGGGGVKKGNKGVGSEEGIT